ncbi:MAG: hypothetical protein JJ872_14160 [Marivivens sp.]|jgi:hypothetical protein|nr:hypothetical protein [Marivivens sp.]
MTNRIAVILLAILTLAIALDLYTQSGVTLFALRKFLSLINSLAVWR